MRIGLTSSCRLFVIAISRLAARTRSVCATLTRACDAYRGEIVCFITNRLCPAGGTSTLWFVIHESPRLGRSGSHSYHTVVVAEVLDGGEASRSVLGVHEITLMPTDRCLSFCDRPTLLSHFSSVSLWPKFKSESLVRDKMRLVDAVSCVHSVCVHIRCSYNFSMQT